MLTWIELLAFYGVNIVVWLGIALLYFYYFYESDEIIRNTHQTSSSEEGVDNG